MDETKNKIGGIQGEIGQRIMNKFDAVWNRNPDIEEL